MNRKWLSVVAVLVAAAGIIAYKQLSTPKATGVHGTDRSVRPAVLLFADPREAESACGCGQIIRLVRSAAERGVPVQEVAPGDDAETTRAYRVTVNPTVIFLDQGGRVVARYEGEESDVIAAIRAGLERLPEVRR